MPIAYNGSVALHYEVRGEGETLLLSSGLGGSCDYWAPQINDLSKKFRVVTYDHAGCGKSARAVGPRSVTDFALDMKAVLMAAGASQAHIMGHAVGGMMGLQLALMEPDLVQSLVIANGWGAPDPHIKRCFSVRSNLLRDSGATAYVEAQPLFLYPAPWISKRDAQLRQNARHAPEHMPVEADLLDRIEVFQNYEPSDMALRTLSVPVLCLATADDMLVPWTASKALADRLGNGHFVLFPDGGHASSQTDPTTFDAAVARFHDAYAKELSL
ncbi:pyrimidine utilization protein D [Roseovarius sp.]|uniref:pyrimidine utilization protein D n=1 Tax=Roseovarius sp. TaxID=1486281 RepID=UPI00262318F4|nr:pyrimidine utilization protein D [Roseovarius sp.]